MALPMSLMENADYVFSKCAFLCQIKDLKQVIFAAIENKTAAGVLAPVFLLLLL